MALKFYQKMSIVIVLCLPAVAMGAAITDFDSTQPRGAPSGVTNDRGQDLSPITEGMMSPAFRAQFSPGIHVDWKGNIMANAARDPSFLSLLSVSNTDFINFLNALYDLDPVALQDLLTALKLENDVTFDPVAQKLVPEDILPVTADICLRCHVPTGWMEGRSEPPTSVSPFLRGQFWGAAFLEYPGFPGPPNPVDLLVESEAEMEGVQCDSCHRTRDNFRAVAGGDKAAGGGGMFMVLDNIFGAGETSPPMEHSDFQEHGNFCGTCHDVTNPLIATETVLPDGSTPDALHPIERTYTEWYHSSYNDPVAPVQCQDCHDPMEFPGAQSWLFAGLHKLWGTVDAVWRGDPFNYNWVSPNRKGAYKQARARNLAFMRTAGDIEIMDVSIVDSEATVTVKVTNHTGHRLPTGYAEGRQMWIELRVRDMDGRNVYQSGRIGSDGKLVRNDETKIYEHIAIAEGYDSYFYNPACDPANPYNFNILDADCDGLVTEHEKEFHFVLLNKVIKDNRIPPLGYDKAAYHANGAYIVPHDPKDTDYPDGQNWDVTTYTFPVRPGTTAIHVRARLLYQTFNEEFMAFLQELDNEKTTAFGGRARAVPTTGLYGLFQTWGDVIYDIWHDNRMGRPVLISEAVSP